MKLRDNEAGFTLMELVLVILIMGIALLPLMTQMMQSTAHSMDGQSASTAAFLARERLEEALADAASPTIGYTGVVAARYPAESPVGGFPGYSRTTVVSADSTYGSCQFRTVRVTVTSPLAPAVTLTTWVAR